MTKWGYQVQMRVKGKLKCFGTYKTLSEAKQVRISAEKEYRPYVKEIINMEHKPIYLDGVDVSKCRYFLKDTEGQDYNTDEFVKGCCEAKGSCIGYEFAGYGLCRGDKDCYFKQLARKTQECEELKEEQDEIKKFLGISHKTIMQRLEELHERSDKYKDRILELEQECEELKKELNGSEKWRIKAESLNEKLELNNGRYLEALDEIEKELKEDVYCESQECGCDDFEECLKCTKEHILDIINKVKEK